MALEHEDKALSEFLRALGPWCDHIVIGGGYALIIYKLYLAEQGLNNPPVGTRDIDSLLQRKIPQVSKTTIADHLCRAGFSRIFRDYDQPATEAYIKEIYGQEVEVEFLTSAAARSGKSRNVFVAGIAAQPLSYLELSLRSTIRFATRSGEEGFVVSPEAWMFHKGLTFPRRQSTAKTLKDLYGIWYVATQLGNISSGAVLEFHVLARQHVRWCKTFTNNLRQWMDNASPKEWLDLEGQDPSGRLKRLGFQSSVGKLMSGQMPKCESHP